MLDYCSRENNNTFLYINFFFESLAFNKMMWKQYCRAGKTIDDNMAHAHCLLLDS